MPTSDGVAAKALVDELACVTSNFVVVHHEADVALGLVRSDVDVVVDEPVPSVLLKLSAGAKKIGLRPICFWPYDVGSISAFWCGPTGSTGVQLDLTFDPRGIGRYGFRSNELLEGAVRGDRWWRPAPIDEVIYQLRKRLVKCDVLQFNELTRTVASQNVNAVLDRAKVLLTSAAASELAGALHSHHRLKRRLRTTDFVRYARRVRNPIGYWAHLPDADPALAQQVADRFDRVLVRAVSVRLPDRAPATWCEEARIGAHRLRPHAIFSTGARRQRRADGLLEGCDVDDLSARAVDAMARRVTLRLADQHEGARR